MSCMMIDESRKAAPRGPFVSPHCRGHVGSLRTRSLLASRLWEWEAFLGALGPVYCSPGGSRAHGSSRPSPGRAPWCQLLPRRTHDFDQRRHVWGLPSPTSHLRCIFTFLGALRPRLPGLFGSTRLRLVSSTTRSRPMVPASRSLRMIISACSSCGGLFFRSNGAFLLDLIPFGRLVFHSQPHP